MSERFTIPAEAIREALRTTPTPFHIYDVRQMRDNSNNLFSAMKRANVPGFKNFYAVKALPNPHVLQRLQEMGHGFDCSSGAELLLAEQVGARGEQIMFTSNNTSMEEFKKAYDLDAIINFDDLSLIEPFLSNIGTPTIASCRYNPGNLSVDSEQVQKIIGKPAEAKYGMDKDSLRQSYRLLKEAGVKNFGLHTMLLSNNLSWQNHAEVARVMLDLAKELSEELNIHLSFVNLGGGIGVPYRPEDNNFDYDSFASAIRSYYDELGLNTLGSPAIVMENGRSVTATAGWLVTNVRNRKNTHKQYVGVDASMADLMRPGMYGAYHYVSHLNDVSNRGLEVVDIVGPLCENNDKFAIDRELPRIDIDDTLVVHMTGAHGHTMGFNYNGRLRSAEILAEEDGSVRMIRRAETIDDLFATIVPLEDET